MSIPSVHPAWPYKDSPWVSPCASGVLHWVQGVMKSRAVVYLSLSMLWEQSPLPLAPESFRLFCSISAPFHSPLLKILQLPAPATHLLQETFSE